MNTEPTQREFDHIQLAWGVMQKITEAMGPEQELELLKVKSMIWGEVSKVETTRHADTFAEGLALSRIRDGIRRKLQAGEDNDKFYRAHQERGLAEAYELGQKLVRWNRLMERRLVDRLIARKGPLEPAKLLLILDKADESLKAWRGRI